MRPQLQGFCGQTLQTPCFFAPNPPDPRLLTDSFNDQQPAATFYLLFFTPSDQSISCIQALTPVLRLPKK